MHCRKRIASDSSNVLRSTACSMNKTWPRRVVLPRPPARATGNVLGAEYLVQVVVTDYESNTSGKSGGVGGLLRKVPVVGGIKAGSSKGRVGLNIRLIDAETSEITFSKQIEAVIKETNFGFAGAGWTSDALLGGFLSSYAKTPIGQAVIAGV